MFARAGGCTGVAPAGVRPADRPEPPALWRVHRARGHPDLLRGLCRHGVRGRARGHAQAGRVGRDAEPFGHTYRFTHLGISQYEALNRVVTAATVEVTKDGRPAGRTHQRKAPARGQLQAADLRAVHRGRDPERPAGRPVHGVCRGGKRDRGSGLPLQHESAGVVGLVRRAWCSRSAVSSPCGRVAGPSWRRRARRREAMGSRSSGRGRSERHGRRPTRCPSPRIGARCRSAPAADGRAGVCDPPGRRPRSRTRWPAAARSGRCETPPRWGAPGSPRTPRENDAEIQAHRAAAGLQLRLHSRRLHLPNHRLLLHLLSATPSRGARASRPRARRPSRSSTRSWPSTARKR